MTPSQLDKSNESQVFENLYGYSKDESTQADVKIKFKSGNYVRIVKNKSLLEKGYTAGWLPKIFVIDKVLLQDPVLYTLKEITIEEIPGKFYAEESNYRSMRMKLSKKLTRKNC
jgi:hypothetical protein